MIVVVAISLVTHDEIDERYINKTMATRHYLNREHTSNKQTNSRATRIGVISKWLLNRKLNASAANGWDWMITYIVCGDNWTFGSVFRLNGMCYERIFVWFLFVFGCRSITYYNWKWWMTCRWHLLFRLWFRWILVNN